MGTFGYMAPEQARDSRLAGKPADVFGLGATLYTLLAGRPPFRGRTFAEVFHATMQCAYKPLSVYRPDCSPNLEAVVARCLKKEPAERYADGAELARALEEGLALLGDPQDPTVRRGNFAAGGAAADESQRVSTHGAAALRVLVIDDDSVSRVMFTRYLAKLPWSLQVETAASAEEAQMLIECRAPDIVVTDLCMSGADGYEMIEWIRSHPNLILTPVVVTSSIPENVGKQRCLMIGADAYLSKPVSLEAVQRVMTRMVARVRPETKS